MFSSIRRISTPPSFEDEEKTHSARLLHAMLLILTLVIPISTGLLVYTYRAQGQAFDWSTAWIGALITAISIGLLILTHRGNIKSSSIVITLLLLGVVFYASFSYGGILDTSVAAYLLIIILAGILLGGRSVFIFTVLSILLVAWTYFAETTHIVIYPPQVVEPFDLIELIATLTLGGLLLNTAIKNLNNAYNNAKSHEHTLAAANIELQNVRASLEQRVAERTMDLEHRALQLQAAAEVGQAATTIRNQHELLSQVTHLISERFDFYHAGVFLLDKAGEYAVLQAANSEGGQRMLARNHKLQVAGTSIVGYVTAQLKPRIALDVGQDATYFDNPDMPETRSEMALPLIAGGKLLGALDVQSKRPAAFTDDDIAVLQVLADQVAIAIENARLFTENQETLEAARRAYSTLSQEAWRELLRSQPKLGFLATPQENISMAGEAWTSEMLDASRRGENVRLDEHTLAIPIVLRDQVLGVVRLKKDAAAPPWNNEEISLMDTLVDQLEFALENARLHRGAQQRAARESLVTEITTKIRSTTDPQVMIETAISELRHALHAKRAQIMIQENTPS